ncbi:hypothetical protein SAMN04489726_2854 [Allokutzneria albata]|uniref:Uncharacterized protein n=1 Tax=Allokutzneria albata TaxID=211114 RepID=A0A1G9V6F5_ALLAB|nr:hypothetical protein SAMN04489726_2854 [Allokutzneria albata]
MRCLARALVRWKSAEEGGRVSGPPTAPVYAATAVFVEGGQRTADHLSILLQDLGGLEDGRLCAVDFLVRELAAPHLVVGGELLVMEGPKVVATARVIEAR